MGASYVQAGYQLRSSANRSMYAALVQSPEAGTQPGHIGYILSCMALCSQATLPNDITMTSQLNGSGHGIQTVDIRPPLLTNVESDVISNKISIPLNKRHAGH